MKNIPKLLFLWALLTLLNHSGLFAQTDVALLRDLAEENKKSVEALVLYPAETRLAILEATKYPEVLIKMQDMREKTGAAFRTLIEDFPRQTQTFFYDLSRYPGMTESLVSQKNNAREQQKTLEALPEDKREEAFGVVSRQMPTLEKINDLNRTTNRAFEKLITTYPPSAKAAFKQLLDLPEVIDLLNEDLRFTVMVGDVYRDNPAWAIHKMDSLNLAVARAHAEELDSWKTAIDNDPDAKAELESAASEYAAENNYAAVDEYDAVYERDIVVTHYYYNPYPYWYGYPWWEPYPRWHPYPWWWDWGFNHHHGVVIVYLPSHHFMHWYFDHPGHHHRYNHLSTQFVNHYNGHRRSGTTISEGVGQWHDKNRSVISEDFMKDKKRLPERLSEFGRFEESRQDYNDKNPRKPVSQTEFLDKNARKYPEIRRSSEVAKTEVQREKADVQQKRSDWAPSKAPATPEPAARPTTVRPPRQQTEPVQKPQPAEKPSTRQPSQRPETKPDDAKDYHRQKWEENKPAQQPAKTSPSVKPEKMTPSTRPAPKTEKPAPAVKTEKMTPKKRGN